MVDLKSLMAFSAQGKGQGIEGIEKGTKKYKLL